jgi:hypothetical protein
MLDCMLKIFLSTTAFSKGLDVTFELLLFLPLCLRVAESAIYFLLRKWNRFNGFIEAALADWAASCSGFTIDSLFSLKSSLGYEGADVSWCLLARKFWKSD